jgi:hypothetical protein
MAHCTSLLQTSIPCAGLTVFDFPFSEPILIADGATVTFVRCSFTCNSEAHSDRLGAALIAAFGGTEAGPATSRQATSISLQQCTFKNNSAGYAVRTQDLPSVTAIYSDDATLKIVKISSSSTSEYSQPSAQPLSAVPAGRVRINCSSAWLQRVQQVRSSSAPSPTPLTSGYCCVNLLCTPELSACDEIDVMRSSDGQDMFACL